ncbi:aldose epimerase family protein [Rhodopila sp.]|uniref:aldose epimerase family protein n=1 Tax=Rhodopila sp. TaxID=2480087 RepID=UPI003D10CDC1
MTVEAARPGVAADATTMKASQRSRVAVCLASVLATAPAKAASLTSAPFGTTADGKPVTRYTMATRGGVSVSFMNYGGAITDLTTPDRQGHRAPIVLGFPTLRDYETKNAENELYFGALIGRYANWIARGRFSLDGHEYQLALSDPPNTIHGGKRGFDKRVWNVQPDATSGQSVRARLTYTSIDGEEGYPGTLRVSVTYTLSEDAVFAIHYEAMTDQDTVINLTNHMNFNLAGAGSPGGVLGQILTVDADQYLPLDRSQIPLGQRASVNGTPFDFRKPTAIGAHIHDKNEQLAIADGYDQNWVLNKHGDPARPQPAVRAFDPGSGRTLDCLTTEPGVQIYTAGFFNGSYTGIGGRYGQYAAFTLETQHFPDSPNHPDFPTTELKPGQVFDSTTIFRFGVRK